MSGSAPGAAAWGALAGLACAAAVAVAASTGALGPQAGAATAEESLIVQVARITFEPVPGTEYSFSERPRAPLRPGSVALSEGDVFRVAQDALRGEPSAIMLLRNGTEPERALAQAGGMVSLFVDGDATEGRLNVNVRPADFLEVFVHGLDDACQAVLDMDETRIHHARIWPGDAASLTIRPRPDAAEPERCPALDATFEYFGKLRVATAHSLG